MVIIIYNHGSIKALLNVINATNVDGKQTTKHLLEKKKLEKY